MEDIKDERLEGDALEEVVDSSDRDLKDLLEAGEEPTEGEETPREVDPPPQTLAWLKRQRRSRRSLILVILLCFGLGVLVLAVSFVMKPEVRKPRIVAKRPERRIPVGERGEGASMPGVTEKIGTEEERLKSAPPEGEKPIVSKPPEPSVVIQESGEGKKVFILGAKEVPGKEEEVRVGEEEVAGPEIKAEEEAEPQVARREEPKIRGIPEGKLAVGKFTVNVGSFRERARAERLMKGLEGKGYKAFVEKATIPKKGTWYRVSVGRFASQGEAQAFARSLKGKDGMDSFVRKLEEKSMGD